MADRKRIYLCLAHMSEEGIEQKYIKEASEWCSTSYSSS